MADQTQRLEIATVKAEVGSNILFRFANDDAAAAAIPTDSGSIQNLKQVIADIQEQGAEKISIATTIYQSAAAGLAATADGGIFLIQSSNADEIYTVWKNQGGAAVNTGKTAMSSQAIQDALSASNEAALAAENAADVATNRTAGFLAPAAVAPTIRNDGLPLQIGDRYFNTEAQAEYIYKAEGWVANDSLEAIAGIEASFTIYPAANKVPLADADGKIDMGWLSGVLASQEELDAISSKVPLAVYDYLALRGYEGEAAIAIVTKPGIAGFFVRLADGAYTDDNGITITSPDGYAWKRIFSGRVNVKWFGAVENGVTDCLAAFSAASAAASKLSSGLSGDVEVPVGGWFLSGPVPTGANWYVDGAATIIGLPSVGSPTIPIHDTSYLTGQVFDFRAGTAAQVRIGDPRPWLTKDWRPISECIATMSVINPNGRPAGLFATRTSDRPDTGALSYAISASVVNDDTVNVKGGWSAYLETYRAAGAGNTFGMETDFLNLGDTVNLDPFSNLVTGLTCNLWMGCGGGSTPLPHRLTTCLPA